MKVLNKGLGRENSGVQVEGMVGMEVLRQQNLKGVDMLVWEEVGWKRLVGRVQGVGGYSLGFVFFLFGRVVIYLEGGWCYYFQKVQGRIWFV